MGEWMEERGGPGPPRLALVRVDEVRPGQRRDLGTLGANRLHFPAHGSFGDADRARDPEPSGGPSHRAAVVSAAACAHAKPALGARELRASVPPAPDFERPESVA